MYLIYLAVIVSFVFGLILGYVYPKEVKERKVPFRITRKHEELKNNEVYFAEPVSTEEKFNESTNVSEFINKLK